MNRITYKSIFQVSLAGLLALFLGFLALRHRVPGLTREFAQDEYAHFIVTIAGRHIVDFLYKIGPNLQPALDYILLRFVWVPILGWKELSFRLPPLLTSLATQLAVFAFAYWFLNKKTRRSGIALLLAFSIGLWAATHITEVFYATSSRHYALVAFLSLLWSVAYFLPETNSVTSVRFFFLSLLFANVHFFAIPLVAGAYGLEFLRNFFSSTRSTKRSLRALGALLLIVMITVVLNWPSLRWLIFSTPSGTTSLPFYQRLIQAIPSAWQTWTELYKNYLDWPLGSWTVLAITSGLLFLSSNRELKVRFFFFLFVVQPVFYFLCRFSSTYFFGERYHTPFYGFGFVCLVLLMSGLFELASEKKKWWKFLPLTAALTLFFVLSFSSFTKILTPHPSPLLALRNMTGQLNFSQNFKEQKFAQETRLPLLWMHDSCWESDNPIYYLSYNSAVTADVQNYVHSYPYGFLIVNSNGCEQQPLQSFEEMRRFYEIHKKSLLILRAKDVKRGDCIQKASLKLSSGIQVKLMPEEVTNHCVWVAEGVRNWEEVRQIVKTMQFPHKPELFP